MSKTTASKWDSSSEDEEAPPFKTIPPAAKKIKVKESSPEIISPQDPNITTPVRTTNYLNGPPIKGTNQSSPHSL
jgi:hypothetical protein